MTTHQIIRDISSVSEALACLADILSRFGEDQASDERPRALTAPLAPEVRARN